MKEETVLRPLGKLLNLIETNGFKVEYHHDDLVFIDNTAFIFRFDESIAELVHLHFNIECDEPSKKKLTKVFLNTANTEQVNLTVSNDFELRNVEGKEEFQLVFK